MRKLIQAMHRGETGIGVIAIALIIAALAGTWFGGNWFLQNTSVGQDFVHIFQGGEEGDTTTADATAPEDVVRSYQETWSCWHSNMGSVLNSYPYVVWNCTDTGQITSLGWRIGRSASGTRYTEGRVYLWDAALERPGALVGAGSHVPYMSLGYRNYPGLQPITYYYFDEAPITLYEGVTYAIGVATAGGSGDLWNNIQEATTCENVVGVWLDMLGSYLPDNNYGHSITEMVISDPTVTTSGHTILENGDVRLEGWAEVIGTMDCGFYYGTNETLVGGSNSTRVVADTSAAEDRRFGFTYDLPDVQNGVTYYYKAFSEIVGLEFYGTVEEFTRQATDIPVTLQCQLIQNDGEAIRFETRLVGSNGSTAYNITLDYGSTYDLMLDQDGQATVVLDTTDDGYWRNTFAVNQTFEAGTTHWFRATAVGNDTSIAHSTADSFVPWDPDQPPIINEIIVWLEEHGWGSHSVGELWWFIFFAGLALFWILAGILKWKWLGIIGTAASLIPLIYFGMAPVWLVILLVLIAGWIIFKIIFKAAGATGE